MPTPITSLLLASCVPAPTRQTGPAPPSPGPRVWLTACERRGLERSSLARNARRVNLHINPFLGTLRLSQLTVPRVRTFEDELAAAGCAPVSVRDIMVSLGAISAGAQGRGLVAQNVVRARGNRRKRDERKPLERRLKSAS